MGIGAAAQTHVACACERLGSIPCGITGHHFYEDEPTLETRVDIDGRRARLPQGPGLGVEPVEEVRRRFSA
jgi:L-alanine-DL-glutamate epimerase-like enolase superfamily enzyme